MAKKNRQKRRIGFQHHTNRVPGYQDLLEAVKTHAPEGTVCFINSEWDEDETVRMARCNGYNDFHLEPGHYQLVDGQAYFQELGAMVFIDRRLLATNDLLDYR